MLSSAADRRTTERGGFLLELLVAFALVSTSLVVLVNTFITLQRTQRVELARKELVDTVAFALADMTREARVSNGFGCGDGNTCEVLTMRRIPLINNQMEAEVRYSVSSDQIMRSVGGADGQPITIPSVNITSFSVWKDPNAPRVVVSIAAELASSVDQVDPLYVQTAFTERSY